MGFDSEMATQCGESGSCPEYSSFNRCESFLGMVNYYGKFLPDLSNLLSPLYRLLQKEHKWTWEKEQQEAFGELKSLLTSDRILMHYNPNKQLVLACDASPHYVISFCVPAGSLLLYQGLPLF